MLYIWYNKRDLNTASRSTNNSLPFTVTFATYGVTLAEIVRDVSEADLLYEGK